MIANVNEIGNAGECCLVGTLEPRLLSQNTVVDKNTLARSCARGIGFVIMERPNMSKVIHQAPLEAWFNE